MPTSSEWASFTWLAVGLVLVVSFRNTRSMVAPLIRTACNWKILAAFAALIAWVALEVLLGWQFQVWDDSLITTTALWFVTVAIALMLNTGSFTNSKEFVVSRLPGIFAVPVLLGMFFDVSPPGFVIELILQPILFFLLAATMIQSRESNRANAPHVAGILAVTSALVLFVLVAREFAAVAAGWPRLDKHEVLLQFSLPFWLSLGVLPLVCAIGVMNQRELEAVRSPYTSTA